MKEQLWDFRNCQTLRASPAELGGLHVVLVCSTLSPFLNFYYTGTCTVYSRFHITGTA